MFACTNSRNGHGWAPENQNSPFGRKRENQNNIYEAWQVVWFQLLEILQFSFIEALIDWHTDNQGHWNVFLYYKSW